MVSRAIAVWIAIAILAVLNGVFREGVLKPRFGDRIAHVLSTLSLSTLIFLVTFGARDWIDVDTLAEGWAVGIGWVLMTLAFEFLAGHYLFGNPWSKILADYRVDRGRVWLLVPACTLFAPAMAVQGIPGTYAIPYAVSLVVASAMLLTALTRPNACRWMFALLFTYACVYNLWLGTTHPKEYQGFADLVIVPWYRDVIVGPFREHDAFYIVAIALGQGITALGWMVGGRSLVVGALGSTLFLASIAPFGVGSAFPFSVLVAIAGWVVWGELEHPQPSLPHLSKPTTV